MANGRNRLSKTRQLYCINCFDEITLNLAERRGDTNIKCGNCNTSFSLYDGTKFQKNISNTTEGLCPNCLEKVTFTTELRHKDTLISCPYCKDEFYIDEVESEVQVDNVKKTTSLDKKSFSRSPETDQAVKYFLPDIKISYYSDKTEYILKESKFNREAFITWFFILSIIPAIIFTYINLNSYGYDDSDLLIDFIGLALGFMIPSVMISAIIALSVGKERELSAKEVSDYLKDYKIEMEK